MPGYWNTYRRRMWATMSRFDRKQWHRRQALRALGGLPPEKRP